MENSSFFGKYLITNSLAVLSTVTIICVRMKCALFNTKFTTIITMSCPDNSESSTIKSMLRVFYCISRTRREWSSSTGGCHMGFVLKYRSYVLTYYSIYWNI